MRISSYFFNFILNFNLFTYKKLIEKQSKIFTVVLNLGEVTSYKIKIMNQKQRGIY